MTQAQAWRYFAEGPSSLTPDQLAKMKELYPDELEDSREPSVAMPELKRRFFTWLDQSTARAPLKKVRAFAVCLYEGVHYFEADFFGCPIYVPGESDWACTWCHEGKSRFTFCSDKIESEWEEGLRVAKTWLAEYLRSKRTGAMKIRKVGVAAIGFSDGDLHVILPKKETAQPVGTDNSGASPLRV